MRCIKAGVFDLFHSTNAYMWLRGFIIEVLPNDILPHIWFWNIRKTLLKIIGLRIGNGSFIMKKNYFINLNLVEIGQFSHINRDCVLDARGGLKIGNNVSVSHNVMIMTGSHDIGSKSFPGIFKPITIDDYAWLGARSTILQGVHIGKGAVVCAGAVVVKDVEPFMIVGGVPAKVIGKRTEDLEYKCSGWLPFT